MNYIMIDDSKFNFEDLQKLRRKAIDLCHDINNDLGAIQGYSDMLSEGINDSEKAKRFSENIVTKTTESAHRITVFLKYCLEGPQI